MSIVCSYLLLVSIPLDGYNTADLSINLLKDRHLGWFQFLMVINSCSEHLHFVTIEVLFSRTDVGKLFFVNGWIVLINILAL